ncbi:diaminopimelate epimerase [Legionella sp. MW5194]|uniref:diaminopimelate epimerase n=1 Tax=Legionella sp. MW5194 TaxID=2662448 RepID=UPI00193CFF08|nr:diaminopimelate epimerase [Legionella sp. MW5194]
MAIKFTKMHGLGNDFMVIDAIHQTPDLRPRTIARLAAHHTGIGFDQCLIVEKSTSPDTDFFYRIFNADGQEVGQCGNGARCLARFLHHYGLTDKKRITVATPTTRMQLFLNDDKTVTVDMGIPRLNPAEIPMFAVEKSSHYPIPLLDGTQLPVHAVNVGNPHAVLVVDEVANSPVATLGKEICEHRLFPEQVNVGFMEIVNPKQIRLRVYERGCGETSACGSGAVAAVAAGRLFHQLESTVKVILQGGELTVEWPDMNSPIQLTGPAVFVYEGVLLCA